MNLFSKIDDHRRCLDEAARLIGVPVQPVTIAWRLEQMLRQYLKLEQRTGVGSVEPFLCISSERRGQYVEYGFERYTLTLPDGPMPIVEVTAPQFAESELSSFWAVPVGQLRRLYRFGRRLARKTNSVVAPVMRETDRELLWKNTIGFLRQGQELLGKYGVARKRGVLLLGEPGNGKTTACRWLYAEAQRRGLLWKAVDAQQFLNSCSRNATRELFDLEDAGIILFDDFDQALWKRGDDGADFNLATFLTELDGVQPREGVVYIFTSNARLKELDVAFRRPGRIDLVVEFNCPNATLRREFIEDRWHTDIRGAIDVDRAVQQTDRYSFAELDELRKLLVLHFMEHKQWDWDAARRQFVSSRPKTKATGTLGFRSTESRPASTTVASLRTL